MPVYFLFFSSHHSQTCFLSISLPLQFRPLFHPSAIHTILPYLSILAPSSSLLFQYRPPPISLSFSCQQSGLSAVASSSISPIHLSLQPLRESERKKPQAAFLRKPVAAMGINMRSLGRCHFSLKMTFKLFHKYEIKPRAQMGLHPLLFWLRVAVILSSPA